jgi:CDGSH-type Zn-finger protein/truncated hemoglobin YjbI
MTRNHSFKLFLQVLTGSSTLFAVLQRRLEAEPLESADAVLVSAAADRLKSSVIRPLLEVRSGLGGDSLITNDDAVADEPAGPLEALRGDWLWSLAQLVTQLRVEADLPLEVQEACAALQDLACIWAPPDGLDERLQRLWELQAELEPSIQSISNGPYLATNIKDFETWLGVPIPVRPQMALCRCGQSKLKPFCDGAHAEVGFNDAKDPNRVPDRQVSHQGLQVTVLDNRGICQHSGFCTDRLSSVFRQSEEPFVRASGGRLDEVIQAVRACPSGALSYAVDGREERDQVDWHQSRQPAITVSKDGPYRVTGGIPLLDAAGRPEARVEGASLEHYALCRCGHSQNKPFCSGMHWYVQFHDPIAPPDHKPTLFEWCGGLPALTRMTRIFYGKYVAEDPLLQPLFGKMSPDHPERVARWLAEVFGGPKLYSTLHGGYQRMLSQHIGRGIKEEQRSRWVTLLTKAANDAGVPNDPEFRSVLSSYIEWGSRLAVENSSAGAAPPPKMPMPSWDWETAAGPPWSRVSAIRSGDELIEPIPEPPREGETVSFAKHIKGRFRAVDRRSMLFAFDLWSVDDVRTHADAILLRLRSGTMPCDGAWPADGVEVFQRWVDARMAE